jgi:arsenite-transporting ATPase
MITMALSLLLLICLLTQRIHGYRLHRLPSPLKSFSKVKKFQAFATMKDILSEPKTSLWTKQKKPQFVFVGGKGGVGKTTTSSAISLACNDHNLQTLIVSTDPAHSLGDCLDIDLSSGLMTKLPNEQNLWALEVDIKEGLKGFQDLLNIDPAVLAKQLNLPKEIFNMIDFEEIVNLFRNPPPGIDEVFALTKILEFVHPESKHRFDRIIVDTAPTGHTLRLLQIPSFLSNSATKILKVRAQIDRMVNMFTSLFSGNKNNLESSKQVVEIFAKIETLQKNLQVLTLIMKDPEQTQFIIVTIPTFVAFQETQRLLSSLQRSSIGVSSIICNQLIRKDINEQYMQCRSEDQKIWIDRMKSFLVDSSSSSGKNNNPIEITEVPYVSNEITTYQGLKSFQNIVHPLENAQNSPRNPMSSRKLTIFGGKGGVGKSTSSASWAVRLSEAGFKTLLVSTDPAHSLSDVFRQSFQDTPVRIDKGNENQDETGGELYVLEIDPKKAVAEFKESATKDVLHGASSGADSNNNNNFLMDLLFDPNDPPPGIDELAAISKVIAYFEDGYREAGSWNLLKFDRIVLDTAPTGHTLRMLEIPEFMDNLFNTLRKTTSKLAPFSGLLGGGGLFTPPQTNSSPTQQKVQQDLLQAKLQQLQSRMKKFTDMIHNEKETEFAIVTIPTELAFRETQRLISSLHKQNVLVRRVVVNQIIRGDESTSYIENLHQGQNLIVEELTIMSEQNQIPLIKIPYFPTEMRTVDALRHVGKRIFPETESSE